MPARPLYRSAFLAVLTLAACATEDTTQPAIGGGISTARYLDQAGARQPIDLPPIELDLPDQPASWETSGEALVTALTASGGRAFVSFKEVAAPALRLSGRRVAHRFLPQRTITRGRRAALSAATARRGLANLEARGARIVAYYEQFGTALIEIEPAAAPALQADSTLDWIEPVPGPGILFVERSPLRRAPVSLQSGQVTPWGVLAVKAPAAWPTTRGFGARLFIADGGVLNTHPDLPAATCVLEACQDAFDHGTGVLGVAAARDNYLGTVGVAPDVSSSDVYSYRVCSATGEGTPGGGNDDFFGPGGVACDQPTLVLALNWAVANTGPNTIINMSLGWRQSADTAFYAMRSAIGSAWAHGKLLVAAAGNVPKIASGTVVYPAGFSEVLGVSGVDDTLAFAQSCPVLTDTAGSNRGPHVMLAGPFYSYTTVISGGYAAKCGTSFSAPFVSGVAALVWSRYPSWSNQRLYEHLLASALDRGPSGWDDATGYGVVQATLSDVFAPPVITASKVGTRPFLSWNAVPAANSYRIYRRVNPDIPSWTLLATTTGTSYTDFGFVATSFDGYNTDPLDPSASYYVVAVTQSGIESEFFASYATFLGTLLQ